MSGTLPPNYNPNDSLLSGGDAAKIIPVQGGGFLLNGNYNADASLLSGGENVKIEPVQGGGAKTEKEIYDDEVKQYHKDMEQYTKDKEQYDRELETYRKEEKRLTEEDEKRRTEKYKAAQAEWNKLKKSGSAVLPPPPTIESPSSLKPSLKRPDYPRAPSYPVRRVASSAPKLNVIKEENEESNNTNTESKSSSYSSGVPSANNIEDLDLHVLVEGNDVSGPNEVAETIEEEEKAKPLEIPCPLPDTNNLSDSFESSDDAVDSKTKEIIRLASREYYIRQAKRKSVGETKDDDIMSDWKQQTFTEDEADFLNTLGFSPTLLYSSFYCHQKEWKDELAEFLYHLSVNSCYPASSLLLRGECQRVREFLMIVESNLKAEQLRKLAEKPIPVAGPITLPELEEEEEEKGGKESPVLNSSPKCEYPAGRHDGCSKEGENENENENAAHLQSIKERMGKLNVDNVAEETKRKSIAKKITDFFKSMKPSFLKSKDEKLYDSVLDEIFKLDKEGKLNSNQKNADVSDENLTFNINVSENEEIDEEEMKRQFDEKIKQLKIKKFMESLPDKYRNVNLSVFIQRMVEKK